MQSTRTPSGPEDSTRPVPASTRTRWSASSGEGRAVDVDRAGAVQSDVELLLP